MTSIEIIAPTDEARVQLQADFAMSSADWSRRSVEAAEHGDFERALVFATVARVARVADAVSKGGPI